jgi:hypothetical protein
MVSDARNGKGREHRKRKRACRGEEEKEKRGKEEEKVRWNGIRRAKGKSGEERMEW